MEEIVEQIRARVAQIDPNELRTTKGVFQLNIKNGDEITKTVTIDLNKLQVQEDDVDESPDITVDVETDSLEQMLNKEKSLKQAMEEGKASFTGDYGLFRCLKDVIDTKSDDEEASACDEKE